MCMYVNDKKKKKMGKSIENITLQYSISTIFIVKRTNIFRENIHMKFSDDTGFLLCHSLHSYGILASQDYMIVVVVIFFPCSVAAEKIQWTFMPNESYGIAFSFNYIYGSMINDETYTKNDFINKTKESKKKLYGICCCWCFSFFISMLIFFFW